MLIGALVPAAIRAAGGGYPVGGDHGAYRGIDEIAAYLKDQPFGTVVYAHDLNWHLEYYLFDAYVYRAYFLGPGPLVNDLKMFGESEDARFIVLGPAESVMEIAQAVEGVGYELTAVDAGGGESVRLYRLEKRP